MFALRRQLTNSAIRQPLQVNKRSTYILPTSVQITQYAAFSFSSSIDDIQSKINRRRVKLNQDSMKQTPPEQEELDRISGAPNLQDYENMSPDQLDEAEVSNLLEKMIQGTDFEKKFDDQFERMLAAGLTEEQILNEAMKDLKMDPNADEASFDPSKLNIDQGLVDEYSKMMNDKRNTPEGKLIQEKIEEMERNAKKPGE